MRLVHGNQFFLLHALDQALDQLFHCAVRLHLLQAFAHFVIQKLAHFQSLLDGLAQGIQRVLVQLLEVHGIALEARLKHVIRKRAEQVFHAHFVGQVGNVFGIFGVLHENQHLAISN